MNDLEIKKLQRILEKMKRTESMAKVAAVEYENVYQWDYDSVYQCGLGDGLEMALMMLTPFYDEMFKTHTRESRPIE